MTSSRVSPSSCAFLLGICNLSCSGGEGTESRKEKTKKRQAKTFPLGLRSHSCASVGSVRDKLGNVQQCLLPHGYSTREHLVVCSRKGGKGRQRGGRLGLGVQILGAHVWRVEVLTVQILAVLVHENDVCAVRRQRDVATLHRNEKAPERISCTSKAQLSEGFPKPGTRLSRLTFLPSRYVAQENLRDVLACFPVWLRKATSAHAKVFLGKSSVLATYIRQVVGCLR